MDLEGIVMEIIDTENRTTTKEADSRICGKWMKGRKEFII